MAKLKVRFSLSGALWTMRSAPSISSELVVADKPGAPVLHAFDKSASYTYHRLIDAIVLFREYPCGLLRTVTDG